MEPLSLIIARMNDLFAAEGLSDRDLVNYANPIADKIRENKGVMAEVENITPEQTMLGGVGSKEAVMASGGVHHDLMGKFLARKVTWIRKAVAGTTHKVGVIR